MHLLTRPEYEVCRGREVDSRSCAETGIGSRKGRVVGGRGSDAREVLVDVGDELAAEVVVDVELRGRVRGKISVVARGEGENTVRREDEQPSTTRARTYMTKAMAIRSWWCFSIELVALVLPFPLPLALTGPAAAELEVKNLLRKS